MTTLEICRDRYTKSRQLKMDTIISEIESKAVEAASTRGRHALIEFACADAVMRLAITNKLREMGFELKSIDYTDEDNVLSFWLEGWAT
mgnify:CR=1 FL=1